MAEGDFARKLLDLAERDFRAMASLSRDPQVDDAVVGFHAQQAIEKALKAVLSGGRIAFRRTHDIAELLDLLTDASLPLPPGADRLDELTPYAVEYRYGLIEPRGLDCQRARTTVEAVLVWARQAIEQRAQ